MPVDRADIAFSSSFDVPFATAEEWGPPPEGEEHIEPILTVETVVNVRSEVPEKDADLCAALWAVRRPWPWQDNDQPVVVEEKSLLGVAGQRHRPKIWNGLRYLYDADSQAAIRERIGAAVAQDAAAQVSARTLVKAPLPLLFLWLPRGPVIDLRAKPQEHRGEVIPPTAPELVVPTLRVVRALLSRGEVA
jgi:hypothetical protein